MMSLRGDADAEPFEILKTKTRTRTLLFQTFFPTTFFLSAFFLSFFLTLFVCLLVSSFLFSSLSVILSQFYFFFASSFLITVELN